MIISKKTSILLSCLLFIAPLHGTQKSDESASNKTMVLTRKFAILAGAYLAITGTFSTVFSGIVWDTRPDNDKFGINISKFFCFASAASTLLGTGLLIWGIRTPEQKEKEPDIQLADFSQ